jgi:hypothetical protein
VRLNTLPRPNGSRWDAGALFISGGVNFGPTSGISPLNEGFSIKTAWCAQPSGAPMTTDDEKWESLAAEYLRRLAAEDMLQWTRHWRFAERSIT